MLAFADYRGILPNRTAARGAVVQYELNVVSDEPEPNGHSTLEDRLGRRRNPNRTFKPSGWSDEIIEEVEQLNERLAANG